MSSDINFCSKCGQRVTGMSFCPFCGRATDMASGYVADEPTVPAIVEITWLCPGCRRPSPIAVPTNVDSWGDIVQCPNCQQQRSIVISFVLAGDWTRPANPGGLAPFRWYNLRVKWPSGGQKSIRIKTDLHTDFNVGDILCLTYKDANLNRVDNLTTGTMTVVDRLGDACFSVALFWLLGGIGATWLAVYFGSHLLA